MNLLLKRIFQTNPFTTLGGLTAAGAVVLLVTHQLAATEFLAMLGSAVTLIGLAAKDGARADTVVAREDVPTDMPPAPQA